METTYFDYESYINKKGFIEMLTQNYISSKIQSCIENKITDIDTYYNILLSFSEYSFNAFGKDFNNLFHYDYSNEINYNFIYSNMMNPLIKSKDYSYYCNAHKNTNGDEFCLECLEKYRIVTRHLIKIIKLLRKDLCSIYFIDILYDLIRYENRHVYSFIIYSINEFSDGSSYKSFVNSFGKNKIKKLLKHLNKPFRRCDYKFILKKYLPVIYNIYLYSDKKYINNIDKIYDYMLKNGVSLFKTVPSEFIVIGIKNDDNYQLDIIQTNQVLDYFPNMNFKIGTHGLLEGINFGFYKERINAYNSIIKLDDHEKNKLTKLFKNIYFSGRSIFTKKLYNSNEFITIGFLKKSENTFQNFRLDIHIRTFITNNKDIDKYRLIDHKKWKIDDNIINICYHDKFDLIY